MHYPRPPMISQPAAADDVVAAIRGVLAKHIPPGAGVVVALSGGMDSASMLDAAAFAVKDENNRNIWHLAACHVNHHISPRADAWERFCRRLCYSANIPITVKSASPPTTGGSEEWARRQRLCAFAALPAAAILAAHHSGDQAETVFFRLLRGAGSLGMSAMRHCADLPHSQPAAAKTVILRPWLHIPRARIADYAKARRLRWIEDEDNHNLNRKRNFLRLRALPMMAGGGFDCDSLLPLAARRFTDGAAMLGQLAQLDDNAAAVDIFGARGFAVSYFIAAGEARTRNWLHNALRQKGGQFSEKSMAEAARQIFNAASNSSKASTNINSAGRKPSLHLRFGDIALREWRGYLFWDDLPPPPDNYRRPIVIDGNWINKNGGEVRINCPELGGVLLLAFHRNNNNDNRALALAKTGNKLHLRLRGGGEKINPPGRMHHRAADLLREAGMLPWRRLRLPLVYSGDNLAAIPGVAVHKDYAAKKGETAITCTFQWS